MNKTAKDWVVLYDGFVDNPDNDSDIHVAGIHEMDLNMQEAYAMADKRNNEGNGDVQFYVAHFTSDEVAKFL